MIKYVIMTFIFGFAGNKLFMKNKSFDMSVKTGVIVSIVLIGVRVLVIRYL